MALFTAVSSCESTQKEEQIKPLTAEEGLKELKELYHEFGIDTEKIKLLEDWKGTISREKFDEFKEQLRKELETTSNLSNMTRDERRNFMRKQIEEGIPGNAEHIAHYPDSVKKKRNKWIIRVQLWMFHCQSKT